MSSDQLDGEWRKLQSHGRLLLDPFHLSRPQRVSRQRGLYFRPSLGRAGFHTFGSGRHARYCILPMGSFHFGVSSKFLNQITWLFIHFNAWKKSLENMLKAQLCSRLLSLFFEQKNAFKPLRCFCKMSFSSYSNLPNKCTGTITEFWEKPD